MKVPLLNTTRVGEVRKQLQRTAECLLLGSRDRIHIV